MSQKMYMSHYVVLTSTSPCKFMWQCTNTLHEWQVHPLDILTRKNLNSPKKRTTTTPISAFEAGTKKMKSITCQTCWLYSWVSKMKSKKINLTSNKNFKHKYDHNIYYWWHLGGDLIDQGINSWNKSNH